MQRCSLFMRLDRFLLLPRAPIRSERFCWPPLGHLSMTCQAMFATLTSREALRSSRLRIQFAIRVCVSATRLRIAVAPTTRSLRKYPSPILVIRPNRPLPPDEFCRGTNPRKAANWRPDRKSEGSVTEAAIAVAVSTPTPGIVANR